MRSSSGVDLVSRSSDVTPTMSSARICSSTASSAGRRFFAPEVFCPGGFLFEEEFTASLSQFGYLIFRRLTFCGDPRVPYLHAPRSLLSKRNNRAQVLGFDLVCILYYVVSCITIQYNT